jgi:hypothetical protein
LEGTWSSAPLATAGALTESRRSLRKPELRLGARWGRNRRPAASYRAALPRWIAGSRAVATSPYSTGFAARSDFMSGPRRAAGSGQHAGDRRRGRTRAPDRCGTALAGSSNLRIDRCGTSGTSAVSTSRYRAAGGRTAAAFLDSGAPASPMRATRLQPRRSKAPLPFFARTREEEEWTMPSSNG